MPDFVRRVRRSFRVRASLSFALGAALISLAVAVAALLLARSYLVDQREAAARRNAYLNARLVRDVLRASDADPARVIGSLQREEGSHALFRYGGDWFASSVSMAPEALPDGLVAAVDVGNVATQRFGVRGAPHLAVGVALPSVRVAYFEVVPLRQLDTTLRTLTYALAAAAGITTLGGAVVGFFLTGRLVRPLQRLAQQAEALAAGDVSAVSEGDTDDELRPLVVALNRAIESIGAKAELEARFASDVSHELRAPLAALSAAVEVMQRRRDQLPERTVFALDALSEQVDGFQELVLDLLEMARFDAGRAELDLEPVDPVAVVRRALSTIGADDVEVCPDGAIPGRVLLDGRRISQVVVNLVENARRYAGGATEIALDARDGALVLSVADRGPGVPPDERERIFRRFERGSSASKPDAPSGTGLGLALVAEHVRLHGGSVCVEDAPGGGARFVVELPLRTP
ncbi:MAG TPA: HAMP domain-containing sensor histidine kinase [Acidimicrobiales bacterium]